MQLGPLISLLGGRAVWQGIAQVYRYFPKHKVRENITHMLRINLMEPSA